MGKRRIAILGSTGSIGTQALDVIRQHRDLFDVELLTANNNAELLVRQAIEFDANAVVICNENKYDEVNSALLPHDVKVFAGMDAVCDLVGGSNIDMVLTALVGFSGLRPTVEAIKAGKPVALANKETLVAAGALVTALAREHRVPILPVDSEHSAIFQCLQGAGNNAVSRIHLTASGGPFRTWEKSAIAAARASDALKHPNWSMGAKVTVDSATMMNKGLEVIEAKWLFDIAPDDINVVVHPESVVHSMVEFEDGSVLAQLASPDMREPIQYALAYPERLSLNNRKLDFASLASLSFFAPDPDRFPCLGLAFDAIRSGGNMPCVMNAANEVAVDAFLRDRIGFYDIPAIVRDTMAASDSTPVTTLGGFLEINAEAKARASEILASYSN